MNMQRSALIVLISFLPPELAAEAGPTVPLKPAFLMVGSKGRDAKFLSAILDERQVIHHLKSQWLETGDYRKYALVGIAGVPEERDFKQATFSKEDLARIEVFLKEGGSLLLMGPAAKVFDTDHGKRFLNRLTGKKQPPRDDSGDVTTVLIREHSWIRHLLPPERKKDNETLIEDDLEEVEEEAEEAAPGLLKDAELSTVPILYKQHPWLIRSRFYWLYPNRGNRIIGKRSGKTALYQLPLGRGQIIWTAWDMFSWENPELGESPDLVAQLEILRRICSSLPLYKHSDYLKDRAELIGRDPFAWHRDFGLARPQPDISGWYQARGMTPDIGPSGKDEATSEIRMDAALDEFESTFFHLSNFQTARALRLDMSALKTKAGEELPSSSLRIRIQKAFSAEMLAAALHANGELADYGPIESLDEAKSLAAHLLRDGNSNLDEPIWLFDLEQAGKRAGDGFTFEMDKGSHVAIWLTYEPQKGIVPGIYEGEVRIDAEGGSQTVLPVTVKIRKIRAREPSSIPLAIDGCGKLPLPLAALNCTVATLTFRPVNSAYLADSDTPLLQALLSQPEKFMAESLPPLRFLPADRYLRSASAAGITSLISRGSIVPVGPFLTALNSATGKVDHTTESVDFRRLEKWFLDGWIAHLKQYDFVAHRIIVMDEIDSSGKHGPSIYLSRTAPLRSAGFRVGGTFGLPTARSVQRIDRFNPLTQFWSFPPGAMRDFRTSTSDFERLDSEDEIWLESRSGDLMLGSAYSHLWSGLLALADYPGVVGLHVAGNARDMSPLAFRWGKRTIVCAALERLRDALDSARCHRFLTRKARTMPVAEAAARLELELVRLEIGKRKSLSDFKNLHSALLDTIEVYAP